MTVQSTIMCCILYTLFLAAIGLAEIIPVTNCENAEKYENTSSECHHPFESVNNGCYYFSDQQMDFNEAAAYCEELGHGLNYEISLAMLDYDKYEDQALLDAAAAKGATFWVGGKKDEVLDIEWLWLDGRIVERHASFWNDQEPNDDENRCMAAQRNTINLGNIIRAYIYDHDCSDSLNFICQTGNIKCPTDFIKIGNHCYLQSWNIGVPDLTWQEVRDYCQTLTVLDGYHADLAVLGLEDQNDDHIMFSLIANYSVYTSWIGAYRPDTRCYFQWVDGRELLLESIHWWESAPTCGSTETNVDLYYYDIGYTRALLDDSDGNQPYPFICHMLRDA